MALAVLSVPAAGYALAEVPMLPGLTGAAGFKTSPARVDVGSVSVPGVQCSGSREVTGSGSVVSPLPAFTAGTARTLTQATTQALGVYVLDISLPTAMTYDGRPGVWAIGGSYSTVPIWGRTAAAVVAPGGNTAVAPVSVGGASGDLAGAWAGYGGIRLRVAVAERYEYLGGNLWSVTSRRAGYHVIDGFSSRLPAVESSSTVSGSTLSLSMTAPTIYGLMRLADGTSGGTTPFEARVNGSVTWAGAVYTGDASEVASAWAGLDRDVLEAWVTRGADSGGQDSGSGGALPGLSETDANGWWDWVQGRFSSMFAGVIDPWAALKQWLGW